jgi:ABC-type multidrug transport system ATPase subunit
VLGHDLFLYPELTAGENLRFFAKLYGVPDIERIVPTALERAGLTERAGDAVNGFSRGMRQRLAIERALMHRPRLVLLDEPFTGLDDAATGATKARIAALRSDGVIVLLTTHDLETIDGLVDRALVLSGGRLVTLDAGDGTPLRERYRRAAATS